MFSSGGAGGAKEGFSFGNIAANIGNTTAPAPATGAFTFGQGAATAPAPATGAFSFNTAATAASTAASTAPAPAFGSNLPQAAPAPLGGGFSFGSTTSTTTSTAKPPAPLGGFNFGSAATTPAPPPATIPDKSAGFSFGAAPSTNTDPTSAAPATNTAPTSAAPTFSFGSAPGAAAPTTKTEEKLGTAAPTTKTEEKLGTAAPSGFSFGTPASTTKTTETPKTPSAAAPAGFSFSTPALAPTPGAAKATTAAPVPTTATQTTTTAAPAPSTANPVQPPPPIEYQTRTISEIINTFTSNLEEDASTFLREAKRIAEYDALLRTSQSSITDVTDSISKLMFHQSELDRNIQSVGAFHSSTDEMLTVLEKQVDDLLSMSTHTSPQEGDVQREQMYQKALELNSKLMEMQLKVNDSVVAFNATQEEKKSNDESNQGIDVLVQVLNSHYEHLNKLQGVCDGLENDIENVNRNMRNSAFL